MNLAAMLKQILSGDLGGSDYPPNNDMRMAQPPMEGENSGKLLTPDQMQAQAQKPPPGTISNDKGDLVDFNFDSNPFKKIIDGLPGGGQGTMTGMLKLLFGSDPIAKQKDMLDKSGMSPRIGGSNDPNHVPGAGQDAVLDPTPMATQRQRGMIPLPTPRPIDYSQPTALDPQSIEELRTSLLTQAGQLDPGNPNGLSGRMSSPLAPSDMGRQSQEAINISDDIRGHNGRKSAAIKKGNIR